MEAVGASYGASLLFQLSNKEMVQDVSSADQTEIRNPRLDSLLARIAETIGPVRCELWFGEPGRIDWIGSEVTFHFESDFEMNRVQRHHGAQLRDAVLSLAGAETNVRFVLKPATVSKVAAREVTATAQPPRPASNDHLPFGRVEQAVQEPTPTTSDRPLELGVNGLRARVNAASAATSGSNATPAQQLTRSQRGYELDQFWFGTENQLAETAVRENLAKPGHFSPLLLYGPSGVGKTHLLEAICRRFRSLGIVRSYVCLTAEQFLNEFISGLKSSGLPTFRTKFRDLDLFAIDDIQYLAGKPGTINELNLTLDNLIKKGKQIILTTDRAPLELGQISPELSGRLQGGLNCPLVYPSKAGRRSILDSICRQRSWSFSSDVLDLVAEGIERDCRRLIGALNRLRAVELSTGQTATRTSAERDLKDLIVMGQAVTTLPKIEQLVCEACGVPASELRSEKRTKRISSARMLAMWLSRQHTGNALSEIGDYFGGRSHSTVVAAHKRVEQWFESGEEIELQTGSLPIREAVQLIVRRLRVG